MVQEKHPQHAVSIATVGWAQIAKRAGLKIYQPVPPEQRAAARFMGLDVHKQYLIALGVDAQLQQVWGPQRVQLSYLENWAQKTLTANDAVVLEMTTNAFQLHDDLAPTPTR